MQTIWKYVINGEGIDLPKGAVIRSTGHDPRGKLCIWVELDDEFDIELVERHKFHIIGSGHRIPDNGTYLGHVIAGHFVWHIYHECV